MDRFKFAVTYGKMMGYITDEPQETNEALKCIKVAFVNSKGEPVDVNLNRSPLLLSLNTTPHRLDSKFVR